MDMSDAPCDTTSIHSQWGKGFRVIGDIVKTRLTKVPSEVEKGPFLQLHIIHMSLSSFWPRPSNTCVVQIYWILRRSCLAMSGRGADLR